MKTYAVALSGVGPSLTPWQSDTIFGSLCWALRYAEGDAAVGEVVAACMAGDPPFVLSNAFPEGLLPAPLHLGEVLAAAGGDAQAARRTRWLSDAEFERAAAFDRLAEVSAREAPFVESSQLHASIGRSSGTTSEGGALFELAAETPRCGRLHVYARVRDGFEGRLEALFGALSRTGFGRKKSSGAGEFRLESSEPFTGFAPPAGANAWISLSQYVPAAGDPTDGFYRVMTKFGRMGEHYAVGGNPYKRPLVMLEPGAVFRTTVPRPWYGRAVGGVSRARPEVIQAGFAFAVPARWPS